MAVNVKMGVDLGGFKSGIQEGQNILRGLNAEMKATEAEFKATGNAEQAMEKRVKTLNSQLQVQKGIADQAQRALKAMEAAGVKPTDAAYQKMYATMMTATAGMNEAQAALTGLGKSAGEAATNADSLNNSVNNIGKKLSIDQVLSGIRAITSGLENAARRAVSLGETIWDSVMDAAKWADDTSTQAQMFGIDVETYQRMQKLVTNGMDTTVDAMLKAQKRLRKGMAEGGIADVLKDLSIYATELKDTGGGILELVPKDSVQLFWEAGRALMNMSNEFDKESAAQKLFGRSWEELVPLFTQFANQDEYNKALEDVRINSEEDVNALAELNDKVAELKGNFDTLSREMFAQLAPALTDAADALNGLLTKVMDYLETPEGQEALKNLQEAVSGLFEDLGKIDPESVVQNFTNVFNGLIRGLQWIVDKKDTLIGALKGVVAGWAGLQLTGGVLQILKLIDGLRGLGIIGGGGGGAVAAGGGGAGWLTGLSTTVSGMLPGIASWVSVNGGPVMDWLTHESPIATLLQGKTTPGELWASWETNLQGNVETFSEDWSNNKIAKFFESGVETIRQNLQNTLDYYAGIHNTLTEADAWNFGDASIDEIMEKINGGEPVSVPAELDVETTGADVAQSVGTVTIPAKISVTGFLGFSEYGGSGGGGVNVLMRHANGLPFVPYDGYLAMLHRGERVLTASANRNYTFNSNNYFGNVNLNNGQDIDALCTSIDRHNRQVQSGFGA